MNGAQGGAGRLKALNGVLDHHSPYKPEVNYDMIKQPPLGKIPAY